METVGLVENSAKVFTIKLRRQEKEADDLVRRVHQETTEEEGEEEPTETLQHRPRKRDTEQQGEGSVPKLNSTPMIDSMVVEPRTEEDLEIRP